MVRRITWFGAGAACGFAGALWSYARLRSSSARLQPESVADAVSAVADEVGERFGDFMAEARLATRQVEDELHLHRRAVPHQSQTEFTISADDPGASPQAASETKSVRSRRRSR